MYKVRQKCFNCHYYRAYYSIGYCNLFRERFGNCEQCNQVTRDDGYCEKWHSRRTSIKQRALITMESIAEIYEKLAIVEQVLKEEIEIEKINTEMQNDNK